jgi:EmrB/QacA subfamily drug resistance transporter
VTGYLASAAVCTPLFGRMGDMFGKRRMLVISLLLFGAGSAVSALGNSLEVVVIGRVLQGAGGGIFPLCFGIIRDEFPADRVSRSIGLISSTVGIGGGVGLVVGGLLVDHASWHWIFWLGTAMAAIAAVSTQLFIPESPVRTPGRLDLRGAAVLAVGLVVPLIAVARANDWGWGSARTLGLIAAGLVVLVGWVALERRTPQPLANLAQLASPPVLVTNIATLLVGFGMFGSYILVPQLVEAPQSTGYGFGSTATQAGLLMLPGALSMLAAGPISGILGARTGNKVPLSLGAAVTAFGLAGVALAHGSHVAVIVWNLIASIGIGLAYAAMPNLIVEAVPREQTGEATGFNALVRSVGSSLGSQITSAVLVASAAAGSTLPAESGFRAAFLIAAGMALVAGLIALLIPRGMYAHLSAAEEAGAAAPLGEPALAAD